MSESNMAQIECVPARAEDYEEVMSMSHGIYQGVDYLPFKFQAWLRDQHRHMILAKTEGKIVGFESFVLVDGGETAVVEGLRVAPWMRGQGVAGIIQKYCLDTLHSDHPKVKRVRLTRSENPPPNMLKKYKVIHTKAIESIYIPSDQIEEAIKLLESRLDNLGISNTCRVLEKAEVLKLFEETKAAKELLPGGLLVQNWLPLTTQKPNLELLCEKNVVCMYSEGDSSSVGFLSLGTPPFPVPYAEATYRLDIDTFGVDPKKAKIHVLQQLKACKEGLPAEGSVICFVFAEENLRRELSSLWEGLIPFRFIREQMILEMDIRLME